MHLLFYLQRHYSSSLPPTALLRRLQHTVPPRPAGLLWWLGIRYLPCWGKVEPAINAFQAQMHLGRSNRVAIRGCWQESATTSSGTIVQLTIRLPLAEMLGGSLMLLFLLSSSFILALTTGLSVLTVFVASITGVFGLFLLADARWSISKAEHYFQEVLELNALAAELA
jgi:hypothetical protein